MDNSMIRRTISRSNWTMMILSLFGLLIIAVLLLVNLRYFENMFGGPYPVTQDELIQYTDAGQPAHYWLTIKGDEIMDTGIQYVETSSSGVKTVKNSYMALAVKDRLLIVKFPGEGVQNTTITGWLEPFSGEEKTELIAKIEADIPDIKGVFLPFQLETGNFTTNGMIGLVAAGVAGLACLIGMMIALRRMADPHTHPMVKALARYGQADQVIDQIDMELNSSHKTLNKTHLTNNWVVFVNGSTVRAARYSDIAWLYQHITTYRSYGVQVSKQYTLIIYDRFGVRVEILIGRKQEPALELLNEIFNRSPWAVAGFSPDIEQAWKKDRATFLAAVERRRQAARQNAVYDNSPTNY